jgi:glycosyltransferase involved in cell wall biosynthesis
MKKIAVLLDGGIANDGRVQRTVKSLASTFEIDLYYCNPTNSDEQIFKDFPTVHLTAYNQQKSWFINNFQMHRKFGELIDKAKKSNKKYDIVYSNDYPLLETATLLKDYFGAKLVYDSHEIYIATINQFFPSKGLKGFLYGRPLITINKWIHSSIEKKLMPKVDGFITVCDSVLSYFKKKYEIKNYAVLKNCPDIYSRIERSDKLRQLLNLTSDDKVLLYQGILNPGRGVENIINAAHLLDSTIHFVIIGGGPQEYYLRELTRQKNLKNVHFLGKQPFDELLTFTASADVGILLIEVLNISKELSLPNKVFEYMVASIPFITNELPEASKIVEEVNCGYIISDENANSIAHGINDVFRQLNPQLGENGFQAIKSKYNWKTEFKQTLYLVSNL